MATRKEGKPAPSTRYGKRDAPPPRPDDAPPLPPGVPPQWAEAVRNARAGCNLRQARFAEAFVRCGVVSEAMIAAGYSPNVARQSGARMIRQDNVQAYIRALAAASEDETIADVAEVKQFWTRVMRDAEADRKDRLRASELLAKAAGELIDRRKVEHAGGVSITVCTGVPRPDDEDEQ